MDLMDQLELKGCTYHSDGSVSVLRIEHHDSSFIAYLMFYKDIFIAVGSEDICIFRCSNFSKSKEGKLIKLNPKYYKTNEISDFEEFWKCIENY